MGRKPHTSVYHVYAYATYKRYNPSDLYATFYRTCDGVFQVYRPWDFTWEPSVHATKEKKAASLDPYQHKDFRYNQTLEEAIAFLATIASWKRVIETPGFKGATSGS